MGAVVAELTAHLIEWADRRFRPGTADCAIFVSDWIMRQGGVDPLGDLRGAYTRIEDGMELLARREIQGLEGLFGHLHRVPHWTQARPGDIALIPEAGGMCCGVVGGEFIHVMSVSRGLDVVPIDRAAQLFRP